VTDKFDKTPADEPPMHSAVSKGASVPPPAIKAIPVRHWGRWLSGVVVVAVLGMLVYAFAQGDINWDTVGDFVFDDRIVKGALNTVIISVLSMIIGLVLGVVFAVMRLSKNPVTGAVAWLYIWLFRGTPVYVQLLLWFNLALIFPILNIGFYKDEMVDVMTPFAVALLGLGLNEGAYMAEIVRGSDRGLARARHVHRQDDAADRSSAGDASDRAADRERVHQPAEDLVPGLRGAVHRSAASRHEHRRHLVRGHGDAAGRLHLVPGADQRLQHRPVLRRAVLRPRITAAAAADPMAEGQDEHALPHQPQGGVT